MPPRWIRLPAGHRIVKTSVPGGLHHEYSLVEAGHINRLVKKLDLYEVKAHLADDHVDERLVQSRGVTKRYITWKSPLNVRVTPDSGKGKSPCVFSAMDFFTIRGFRQQC
jgi:hypothetical protein